MTGAQRARRKQDLLLASRALRVQACTAVDQLAARADALEARVVRVGVLLASPAGLAAAGVVGWLLLRRVRRPLGWVWVLRWGWRAWRLLNR